MEKILLNNKSDLLHAIEHFGIEYKNDFTKIITKYPCILVGSYSEDIEFGNGYEFTVLYVHDFERINGVLF